MEINSIDTADGENLADPSVTAWNSLYQSGDLTAWEMIPPHDMHDVIVNISEMTSFRLVAEIGCGRALRMLVTLLKLPELNRANLHVIGIDQCPSAIRGARALHRAILSNESLPEPFGDAIRASVGKTDLGNIEANVNFEVGDLFDWLHRRPPAQFDLLVDWMCFHEIPINRRPDYVGEVARTCKGYFVINLFSKEMSSVADLGFVAGNPKWQFSQKEVEDLFEPWFEIVEVRQFLEDLDPCPKPSDGIVAAKRAYILRRNTSVAAPR